MGRAGGGALAEIALSATLISIGLLFSERTNCLSRISSSDSSATITAGGDAKLLF